MLPLAPSYPSPIRLPAEEERKCPRRSKKSMQASCRVSPLRESPSILWFEKTITKNKEKNRDEFGARENTNYTRGCISQIRQFIDPSVASGWWVDFVRSSVSLTFGFRSIMSYCICAPMVTAVRISLTIC